MTLQKKDTYKDVEWLVIVNPNAGNKKGEKDWPEIKQLLEKSGFKTMALFTEYKLHAVSLTKKAIEEDYKNIIVVGGDGTLNEVLNGITSQQIIAIKDIKVGMIMVGTGNDWGRTFKIPHKYQDAIDTIKMGKIFLQDIASVTYPEKNARTKRYFINMAGLGFDGLVADKTNQMKERGKGGTLAYIINLILGLYQYSAKKINVSIDGVEVLSGKIFSIVVGIGKYNGGGMMQAPDAVPDDGQFEITIFKSVSKLRLIINLHRLYFGTIRKVPFVKAYKGKNVCIESVPSGGILLEVDGESLGKGPYEFQIHTKALQVIINEVNMKN